MKGALAALLLILSTTLTTTLGTSSALAQSIVIDPGHGGGDPGGTGLGLEEKNIVLDTSTRFRDLLETDTEDTTGGGAWTTHLTRETDEFIELAARSAYANALDADRFLSVHANAFATASANGTETFSYSDTGTGANLRNLIQEEMVAAWQLTDRGNKTGNFSVLRNTAMPAELHELGFLTNTTDAQKLGDADERQLAALAHLHGLQRHYGLAPHTPTSPMVPPIPPALPRPPSTIDITVADKFGPVANAIIFLNGMKRGHSDDEGFFRIETPVQLRVGEVALVQFQLTAVPRRDELDAFLNDDAPQAEMDSGGCSQAGSRGGATGGAALSLFVFLMLLYTRSSSTKRNKKVTS